MKPPRLASALLRLCAHRDHRTFVFHDLGEEFDRLAAAAGRARATRWYWRQVAGSVVPLLGDRLRRAPARRPDPHWAGDAVQAWRWLARNPWLTATMTATLVVGLTTTLAASLLLYNVVLRPLPYPDADRLVAVTPAGPRLASAVRVVSLPDLEDFQAIRDSVGALSGFSALTYTLTAAGDPQRVEGLRVGERFAEVLGIVPLLGRAFRPGDFVEGGQPVVLITAGMWRRLFGGSPDVVGRTLRLEERSHDIVGVLPDLPFADVTAPHEFWVPLVARPGVVWEPIRGNGFVSLMARLAPGATLAAAEAELSSVAARLAHEYPRSNGTKTAVRLQPLHEAVVAPVRQALFLVFAAVAAVLLVACGNLANLLLAHAERRRREFGVRLALGAEPHRVRAQVLVEMATIVGVSAAAALSLAPVVARAFLRLYPTTVPGAGDLTLSMPIVGALVALSGTVAGGLALPQLRRVHGASMGAALARMTGSRRDRRGRAALIAVQAAFTVVLAFGGLALLRSVAQLTSIAPGFEPQGLVAVSISPSPARFGSGAATRAFFEQVLVEVRGLPGVRSAAVATAIPFVNQGWAFPMRSPGGGPEPTLVSVTIASPGYFETLGMPLRRGRLLDDLEHRSIGRLVVLNEAAARLLPYDDPVGRILRYSDIEWTIVGVVGSARQRGLRTPPRPEVFLPWSQAGRAPQRLVVRADGDPAALVPAISSRVRALDPLAPVADVMLLDARVQGSVAADRFRAALLACLAAIGVALAGLGVWSVTAFVVARLERENGIRIALGESRRQLLLRMLLGTLRPAAAGVAAGLAIAVWASPLVDSFLFQVRARDPLTLAAAALAVLASAVGAAIVPARRAAAADPARALRSE